MDVWRLMAAAMRRWYVLVALLAAAALAASAAAGRVSPEYTASSSVLIVPATSSGSGNPYADVGTAAQSTAIVLQSGATRAVLKGQGLSTDYEVSGVNRTAILRFATHADTPDVAINTANHLIEAARRELETRQESYGVAPPLRTRVTVLEAPTEAIESTSSRLQAQVSVFGLGAVLAFIAAVFTDDLLLLWRQRRLSSSREPRRFADSLARRPRTAKPLLRHTQDAQASQDAPVGNRDVSLGAAQEGRAGEPVGH